MGIANDKEYEFLDNSQQDEYNIVLKASNGDKLALEYIITKYRNFVKAKAKSYFLVGADKEDIIQEGMIGLYKAVRDFDGSKTNSFKCFAEICITRQIITAIKTATRQKHIPLNSYVSLYDDSGQEGEERRTPLIDTIEPVRENDPEVLYLGKKFTEVFIEQLKDTLSPLENHVMYLHLMGTDYKTIAELLGKSPKSIDNALQRIKAKAEKMLDKSE